MSKSFTDEEMIEAIKTGGRALEEVMTYMYRQYRKPIIKFIIRYKGRREDAEDIFQDGLCRLLLNIRKGQFQGKSSLQTYLTTICRRLWYTKFNKNARDTERDQSTTWGEDAIPPTDQLIIIQEKSQLIADILGKLGEKCKSILGLSMLGYSIKEITTDASVGYKSNGMTRKKKHQCFKKLVALLNDRPDLIQELKEPL